MSERIYDHRDRQDLMELGAAVRQLSDEHKARVVFDVAGSEVTLMVIPVFDDMVKFAEQTFGKDEAHARLAKEFLARQPDVILKVFDEIVEYLENGRDMYDPTSAGGWNRRELDAFLGIVRSVGFADPEPGAVQASSPRM